MKRKTKSKKKTSSRVSQSSFNAKFAKFKKAVEQVNGKIDWESLSKVALFLLFIAAYKGAFGPKGKVAAHVVKAYFTGSVV